MGTSRPSPSKLERVQRLMRSRSSQWEEGYQPLARGNMFVALFHAALITAYAVIQQQTSHNLLVMTWLVGVGLLSAMTLVLFLAATGGLWAMSLHAALNRKEYGASTKAFFTPFVSFLAGMALLVILSIFRLVLLPVP